MESGAELVRNSGLAEPVSEQSRCGPSLRYRGPMRGHGDPLHSLRQRKSHHEALAPGNARQVRHARATTQRIGEMRYGTRSDQLEQGLYALLGPRLERSFSKQRMMSQYESRKTRHMGGGRARAVGRCVTAARDGRDDRDPGG